MKTNPCFTLITGASLGLGREYAIECAKRGMNLILVSLPGEKLQILAEYLSFRYKVEVVPLEIDLTLKEAPYVLYRKIIDRYPVNMIIHNAGFGGSKPFESSTLEYLDNMIQLNIRAVSLLTRLLLPELKKHPRAWIMNISSMAAFSPMPFKTVYPASKAFVYFFSRGLAEELRDTSVRVSVVHPGPIMTNEEVSARILMQGRLARICLVSAERIAYISLREMLRGRTVIIPGFLNKLNWFLTRILPLSLRLSLMSKVVSRELAPTFMKPADLVVGF